MEDALTFPDTAESNLIKMLPIPVALNLSEGSAKPSSKERAKFYRIALASLRECETIFQLIDLQNKQVIELEDILARHLYKLCKALE